jgi:hypothetical protein
VLAGSHARARHDLLLLPNEERLVEERQPSATPQRWTRSPRACAVCERYSLGAVMNAEFQQVPLNVCCDRLGTDEQARGDCTIASVPNPSAMRTRTSCSRCVNSKGATRPLCQVQGAFIERTPPARWAWWPRLRTTPLEERTPRPSFSEYLLPAHRIPRCRSLVSIAELPVGEIGQEQQRRGGPLRRQSHCGRTEIPRLREERRPGDGRSASEPGALRP